LTLLLRPAHHARTKRVISTRHGGPQDGWGCIQGRHVSRTPDGVVHVQGFDGGRYQTVHTERDEERKYKRSKLTAWSPRPGERVVEASNEDCVIGIVIEAGEEISLVKWGCLLRQVSFLNSCLEPVWID
jgi:hypothetical protein